MKISPKVIDQKREHSSGSSPTTLMAKLLILACLSLPTAKGHTMGVEQMTQLRGAEMLGQRVSQLLSECGLPDAIVDHGKSHSIKKNIQWDSIKMELSNGNWNLHYRINRDTGDKIAGSGWINPVAASSDCFADLSAVNLLAKGGVGVLTIDKINHKTTYTMPDSQYKAHMVIGIEITLAKPLSSEDIIGSYGKGYDMVENHKNGKTIRYWVLEESGQMPISLHAVDFEFNQDDKTCNYYRIATSHFDFVQRKFEELADTWNKYGID